MLVDCTKWEDFLSISWDNPDLVHGAASTGVSYNARSTCAILVLGLAQLNQSFGLMISYGYIPRFRAAIYHINIFLFFFFYFTSLLRLSSLCSLAINLGEPER